MKVKSKSRIMKAIFIDDIIEVEVEVKPKKYVSQETRNKMSEKGKGRVKSEEWKRKIALGVSAAAEKRRLLKLKFEEEQANLLIKSDK